MKEAGDWKRSNKKDSAFRNGESFWKCGAPDHMVHECSNPQNPDSFKWNRTEKGTKTRWKYKADPQCKEEKMVKGRKLLW